MDELLPYYERELGYLRRYSREFADRYPKIAGRLMMSGETSEDPHIERMIQSYALLNARTAKKLEDSYPEFTEALFEVLYPHYLRPFPSCSIARMDYLHVAGQTNGDTFIPRGTELSTRPVRGVSCTFRSAYDVALLPLKVLTTHFDAIARLPERIAADSAAASKISITLDITSEQWSRASNAPQHDIQFFIDGEPSFCAILRDAIFMRTSQIYVEYDTNGQWVRLDSSVLREVGFELSEPLIDFPDRSHPAYRLLTEYFAYPEKFSFFAIDKSILAALKKCSAKRFTLHFLLLDIRSDSHIAKVLSQLTADNTKLGCTPVVNLFKQRGDPIRLSNATTDYSVIPDARRSFAYDIYSIDAVKLVRQTPEGESVTDFRPFYSLKHGHSQEKQGHYWIARRDEDLSIRSPGFETKISIVDIDFNPVKVAQDTLSIELTCTNRDLPNSLTYGASGGDLIIEGGTQLRTIHFLRKPSMQTRTMRGRSDLWRLISHLALNHISLSKGGLDFLREVFCLYGSTAVSDTQKKIDSIINISCEPASAWMPGNPYPSVVRGLEVRIIIDENRFVGSSLHAFISMFNNFLGLYVHTNSFSKLIVISAKTGKELRKCQPRSGNLNLL